MSVFLQQRTFHNRRLHQDCIKGHRRFKPVQAASRLHQGPPPFQTSPDCIKTASRATAVSNQSRLHQDCIKGHRRFKPVQTASRLHQGPPPFQTSPQLTYVVQSWYYYIVGRILRSKQTTWRTTTQSLGSQSPGCTRARARSSTSCPAWWVMTYTTLAAASTVAPPTRSDVSCATCLPIRSDPSIFPKRCRTEGRTSPRHTRSGYSANRSRPWRPGLATTTASLVLRCDTCLNPITA